MTFSAQQFVMPVPIESAYVSSY